VTWEPKYAPAPVVTWDSSGNPKPIPNLEAFMHDLFHEPMTLPAVEAPKTPGSGRSGSTPQMEEYKEKDKPGAATAVDAATWQVTKKFAEPGVNMNNPHNMWSDKDEKVVYQSQWFRHTITVFDHDTGTHIRDLDVGESPAHILTRPGKEGNDNLIIGLNGANSMEELAPAATSVVRKIPGDRAPDLDPDEPPPTYAVGAVDGTVEVSLAESAAQRPVNRLAHHFL
jgi:hypothetical protein